MKFADDWKTMWKWISFQCFALLIAGHGVPMLLAVFGINSGVLDAFAKEHTYAISIATIVVAFLGIFGLTIQQDTLPNWLPWKLNTSPMPEPVPAPVAPAPGGPVVGITVAQQEKP